ncbi:MAG TPA: 2-oxoacid:acceptor oxidoreductase family protein, partial [Verrucomicrobiota bacterium]|nr:2-oxoacid:acceptor oxidoreductase family protein [Verrucomicrobiota bacterium]
SNIQGLPTWYEIRISRDGYVARSGQIDIMVAMNAETYGRDVREVTPGGYLIYDSTWPRPTLLRRDDITVLGVPLARLCNENFKGVRTRILMKNICYAGALAALLDLDLEKIRELLAETYAKKPALVESNMQAIQLGYDYAKQNFPCPLPLRVEKLYQEYQSAAAFSVASLLALLALATLAVKGILEWKARRAEARAGAVAETGP